MEADSFWCLSRLLDGIQDNYIHGQPGIHRGVKRIAELVARIDGGFRRPKAGERGLTYHYFQTTPAPLTAHLESENVEFMQFAFRWMNCLLMREISVQNTIRMWDTYLVSKCFSVGRTLTPSPLVAERRHGGIFTVSSLRVFCIPGEVEPTTPWDGLSGRPRARPQSTCHNQSDCYLQGIIMFLQSLPTQNWGDHEIELLLSEAFVLNSIWHNAQSHFGVK